MCAPLAFLCASICVYSFVFVCYACNKNPIAVAVSQVVPYFHELRSFILVWGSAYILACVHACIFQYERACMYVFMHACMSFCVCVSALTALRVNRTVTVVLKSHHNNWEFPHKCTLELTLLNTDSIQFTIYCANTYNLHTGGISLIQLPDGVHISMLAFEHLWIHQ